MNSIDLAGIDWLGRGWLLILAFTAAVLVVAPLRRPCRRLFGAECAFQLWLLLPLAMLASQLPHVAAEPITVLPPVVLTITSAAAAFPSHASGAMAIDWRASVVLVWLAGSVVTLLLSTLAQSRYRARLRGAMPVVDVSSRWPVLRAAGVDVGPALVGAWRVCIVLPADFEQRYDTTERALILAHETTHARRRDGWWCLLAQAVVAILWFHPLVRWTFLALRHDQELACDAAVLREHSVQRRSYANAMLKTQSAALALPVGCTWSPRHPITERIAMLKLSSPNRSRRLIGIAIVCTAIAGFTGAIYAMSQPAIKSKSDASAKQVFQLAMNLSQGSETLGTPTVCVKTGEPARISLGDDNGKPRWTFDLTVKPLTAAVVQVDIKGSVHTFDGRAIDFHPTLRGSFNSPMAVKVDDEKSGAPSILTITPTQSCAAANSAASV